MSAGRDPAPAPPWSSAPAWSHPDPAPPESAAVVQASGGRYALRELLGRGGMGEVWVGRDTLLGRDVALKRALPGTDVDGLLREASLAALLEHPGIVPVHDVVVLPDGQGLYVMRLVRGRNLAQALLDLPADLPAQVDARCKLVAHVLDACRAVAFAHGVGVLHRDLKSDNLLIGELGDTQVADWGLAGKATELAPAGATTLAGCPAYLSPQRARGASATPQDDVFALGAVLYEVVAGCPPFAERDVDGQWRRARSGERAQPSAAWPHMPAELRAIANKATEPDAAARYPSVTELAADLERWSSGRRVLAHSYSPVDLARRFLTTFRLPLTVAAVALLVVVVLVALGVRRIAGERDEADSARREHALAHAQAQTQLAETLAMQAQSLADAGDRAAAESLAAQALRLRDHPTARGVLAGFDLQPRATAAQVEVPLSCSQPRVAPKAACVACSGDEGIRWQCGRQAGSLLEAVQDVAFFADNDRVVLAQTATLTAATLTGALVARTAWPPGRHRLIGAATAPVVVALDGRTATALDAVTLRIDLAVHCTQTQLLAAAPSPDGRLLAAACAGGRLQVAEHGEPERTLPAPWVDQMRGVVALALPSAATVVVLGIDGSLAVVAAKDGAVRGMWRAGGVTELSALLVRPDSDTAAVLGAVGGLAWVRWTDGVALGRAPAAGMRALVAGDGAAIIATGDAVAAWRPPPAAVPLLLQGPAGLTSVDGSADGRWLAAGTGTGELVLWSRPTGTVAARAQVCGNTAKDVQFHQPSRSLLVACVGAPGLVRLTESDGRWQLSGTAWPVESRRAGTLTSGRLWLTDTLQSARVVHDGVERHRLRGPGFVEGDTAADGARALVVGPRGGVWQIDDKPDPPTERWPQAAAVAVGLSADGQVAALAGSATVTLWEVAGPTLRATATIAGGVQDVAVSADGGLVAVAHIDGAVTVIDRQGATRARLIGHRKRTVSVRFLPGGTTLATASWDGTVRLWSVRALVERSATLALQVDSAWQSTGSR